MLAKCVVFLTLYECVSRSIIIAKLEILRHLIILAFQCVMDRKFAETTGLVFVFILEV